MLSWAKQPGSLNGAPEFPYIPPDVFFSFLKADALFFSAWLLMRHGLIPREWKSGKVCSKRRMRRQSKKKKKKKHFSRQNCDTHKKDTPSPLKWPFYCWGRIHSCQALEPVCRHGTAVGAAYRPPCQAKQEVHCALLINSHSHRGVIGTACQYSVYAKT